METARQETAKLNGFRAEPAVAVASDEEVIGEDGNQRRTIKLSKREVQDALPPDTPAILTLAEAAALARLAPATLKRHVSEGRYRDCVIRGKPLRFWRDRFVQQVMKGETRSATTR